MCETHIHTQHMKYISGFFFCFVLFYLLKFLIKPSKGAWNVNVHQQVWQESAQRWARARDVFTNYRSDRQGTLSVEVEGGEGRQLLQRTLEDRIKLLPLTTPFFIYSAVFRYIQSYLEHQKPKGILLLCFSLELTALTMATSPNLGC